LLSNFSGRGFDAVTVTNTSSRAITVRFIALGQHGVTTSTQLAAHSTQNFSGVASLSAATYLVTTPSPTLVVTTTLPSAPVGVTMASVLDGR
jgi:hypothetical protein